MGCILDKCWINDIMLDKCYSSKWVASSQDAEALRQRLLGEAPRHHCRSGFSQYWNMLAFIGNRFV